MNINNLIILMMMKVKELNKTTNKVCLMMMNDDQT